MHDKDYFLICANDLPEARSGCRSGPTSSSCWPERRGHASEPSYAARQRSGRSRPNLSSRSTMSASSCAAGSTRSRSLNRFPPTATQSSPTLWLTDQPLRPSKPPPPRCCPARWPNCWRRYGRAKREILTLRFGLDGGEPHSLEEVGRHFNLTRERIRQLQARAMCKLRHPAFNPPDTT